MTRTPSSEPAGGDELMIVIAAAVIAVVAAEAAFIVYASWLLLPLIMLGVILAAVGVTYALVRTIDNDTAIPVPTAKPRPAAEPAPTAAPARVHGTPVAGH
jgi:hypothetical protein